MNVVLCLVCLMLVPLAGAGLALIHQGLGRSRSAAHAMLAALCVLAISAVVYVLVGSAWAGLGGGVGHGFEAGGVRWDLLGRRRLGVGRAGVRRGCCGLGWECLRPGWWGWCR